MKEKIDLIFSDLKNEVITEKQAHQQILDLFTTLQSEQIKCPKCGSINKRVHDLKTLKCDDCGKKWAF